MKPRPHSDIIAETSERLERPVPVSELRAVRTVMTALMDQLARAIFARRLDLDDCVVERYVVVRPAAGGSSLTDSPEDDDLLFVLLPSMSEPDALVRAYSVEFRRVTGRAAPDGPLVIVGLRVRAIRTPDYPVRVPPSHQARE
ncbi:MAG: hypothetical protein HOP29_00895 [Phycisphaerales bacterium]|nr:hypothetical protein [Phycisphaerales bacterium]